MEFAKYTRYFLIAILAISVIFIGIFYIGGDVTGTEGGPNEEPLITNTIVKFSYILLFLAIIAVVGFTIINIIGNHKLLKNVAVILVITAVIFLIARLLASDEVLKLVNYKGTDNVPHVLKNVGTGLMATYILLGVTVLSMIYSEIIKYFK